MLFIKKLEHIGKIQERFNDLLTKYNQSDKIDLLVKTIKDEIVKLNIMLLDTLQVIRLEEINISVIQEELQKGNTTYKLSFEPVDPRKTLLLKITKSI